LQKTSWFIAARPAPHGTSKQPSIVVRAFASRICLAIFGKMIVIAWRFRMTLRLIYSAHSIQNDAAGTPVIAIAFSLSILRRSLQSICRERGCVADPTGNSIVVRFLGRRRIGFFTMFVSFLQARPRVATCVLRLSASRAQPEGRNANRRSVEDYSSSLSC
jgi:hypothetical protein